MIKTKKKIKKKVVLNGISKKIDYDAYIVIRNQGEQLQNHTDALVKYVLIHNSKKKHSDDEKLLYDYCMQFPYIVEAVKSPEENESKA